MKLLPCIDKISTPFISQANGSNIVDEEIRKISDNFFKSLIYIILFCAVQNISSFKGVEISLQEKETCMNNKFTKHLLPIRQIAKQL